MFNQAGLLNVSIWGNEGGEGASGSRARFEAANACFARGEFQQALLHYLAILQEQPSLADCHYRAALAYRQLDIFEPAREHLEQAVRIDPDHALAHGELGRLLLLSGEVAAAGRHAARAVELAPDDPELSVALACLLEADRRTPQALAIVEKLLAAKHQSAQLAVLFAQMAPSLHREEQALALLNDLLKQGSFATQRQAASVHFSAAHLLDRMGQWAAAFTHAARAHALRGARYDAGAVERPVNEWIDYFTRPTLRRLPHATHGSDVPVFIVGMLRSGTTLVEQILASHPDVHAAGELNWIYRLCESAARRNPTRSGLLSRSLDQMTASDVDALADDYLRPLQALSPSARRIVDKNPLNFIHLGMIQLLFPRARIIHCRRDPLDTGLSCFMTDFSARNDFAASLDSIAHFYRHYRRMMAHWKSTLDLPILDVDYESVVNDLAGQTARMLQFLELPWNDACLKFHENRRFVATASNEQVRRPIYRTSIGRWRHYERELAPLREALD